MIIYGYSDLEKMAYDDLLDWYKTNIDNACNLVIFESDSF